MGMKRLANMIWKIIAGALILNILWFAAAVILQMNALVDPLTVYANLGRVLRQSMGEHLLASLGRIVAGIGIATLMGVSVGILMSRSRIANYLLNPFIYFTYPIPKLALLPVVMLLAGIGNLSKIILIVLIIVFQIIVATRDAANRIPKETYYYFTSLGASRKKTLQEAILPGILPDLFSTLRIAVGTAISVLFVTETYGTDRGMGYYIVDAWMRINYVDMYAGIVILSLMGFFLFILIDIMDAALCKWKN